MSLHGYRRRLDRLQGIEPTDEAFRAAQSRQQDRMLLVLDSMRGDGLRFFMPARALEDYERRLADAGARLALDTPNRMAADAWIIGRFLGREKARRSRAWGASVAHMRRHIEAMELLEARRDAESKGETFQRVMPSEIEAMKRGMPPCERA